MNVIKQRTYDQFLRRNTDVYTEYARMVFLYCGESMGCQIAMSTTKIKYNQPTKKTYGHPSEQLIPKMWPVSNSKRTKNNMNTHKVKHH